MRQDRAIYKPTTAKHHQNTRLRGGRIATGCRAGMTDSRADFVVIGSTPQARLVAGLLASVHGKSVVFVGESQSGYRLPRGVDVSIAPLTRPETWSVLKPLVAETLKLVSRIGGRGAWSRLDPILFAEHDTGKQALAHISHMALAFGHGAEPVSRVVIGAGRAGMVLRDAALLHRPTLEAGLDCWLEQHHVRRIGDSDAISIRSDGSADLLCGEDRIAVDRAILADDPALLRHLPQDQRPGLLQQVSSTIFTEPTGPIAAPVLMQLDSGLALVQQPGRGIVAMGSGGIDRLGTQLGALLGRERAFRQAGQSQYNTVQTEDCAPAVGRIGGVGADVLAGFGPTGAFFAPAIARWLCGRATSEENAWFEARLVNRGMTPSQVAEVGITR